MSEKKFSEYIIELLRNGKHLVYVQGQGGVGKSTALLECYRKLLAESHLKIIPIFVPIEQCSDDEFAIRRYVYTHYLGGEIGTDVMVAYMNLQRLFEAADDYRYVLLFDGWNEHFSAGKLVSEVDILSRYEKVSIVLTGREEVKDFLDWERVKLVPLSEEYVAQMVPEASEEVRKLLTIPFYLSRYMELEKAGDVRILSAGTLLQQYVDYSMEKFRRANTYAKIKEIDLSEALPIVKNEWFPLLCLEIASQGKMDFSIRDVKLKERIREIPTELDIDIGTVCRKLLVPMGFVTEIGMNRNRFKVVHEIYRDWFAATYLRQLLQEHTYTEEEIIEILSGHVSRDSMRFCADSFEKKDELTAILRDINKSVAKREDLRQNELLNKNIVDFFATVSPILQDTNFAYRNMTLVSLDEFCGVRNVDFTGAEFGGGAFKSLKHVKSDGWGRWHDFVLFPEANIVVYYGGTESHKVDCCSGRDTKLPSAYYGGKYDEKTYYYANPPEGPENEAERIKYLVIDAKTGGIEKDIDEVFASVLLRESEELWNDSLIEYTQNEIYTLEESGSEKKCIFKAKKRSEIIGVSRVGDKLLVEIDCSKRKKWLVNLVDIQSEKPVGYLEGREAENFLKKEETMYGKRQGGKFEFFENEVYISEGSESKRCVLRINKPIDQILEMKDWLLVVTKYGIECYKSVVDKTLCEQWAINWYESRIQPVTQQGRLFFKIEKPDKSSTWAKVLHKEDEKLPEVRILKRFEEDRKEPMLLTDEIALFTEIGTGKLYVLDEQTMEYKELVDFNKRSREGEKRYFSETEKRKAVRLSDGSLVVQVKMCFEETQRKYLELYKIDSSGENKCLFQFEYSFRQPETLFLSDRFVIRGYTRANHFMVISYDGNILHKEKIDGIHGDMYGGNNGVFFVERSWVNKTRGKNALCFFDFATGEICMLNLLFGEDFCGKIVVDEDINKVLFFAERGSRYTVYDTERDGKKLLLGKRLGEVKGMPSECFMYYRKDELFLLDGLVEHPVLDTEEKESLMTYRAFSHYFAGAVFKDVKGFTEEELGILKLYGAEGIKEKNHVTSREQFEREDFPAWEVQQEDALEDDEFSFKTVR